MPVPVSPCKDESSQSASAAVVGALTETMQETAHAPAGTSSPQNKDEIVDPDVVAGYQDCLKETLRFLLEEEHLSVDHPVVMGLAAHLTRDYAHVELGKLSQQLTSAVLACTSSPATTTQDDNVDDNISIGAQRPVSTGYEVTLIEESDDDTEPMNESECDAGSMEECSDSEDIECDDYSDSEEAQVTEAIMGDPELRRQLMRFVYQGCDLIAGPQPFSELHQGLIVQL